MPIKSLSCIITISVLKLLFPSWLFVQYTLSCCINLPHKRPQSFSEDSDWSHPAIWDTSSCLGGQSVTLLFSTQHCFLCCHSTLFSCSPHWVCLYTPNSFAHSFEELSWLPALGLLSSQHPSRYHNYPKFGHTVSAVHLESVWNQYTKWLNYFSQVTIETQWGLQPPVPTSWVASITYLVVSPLLCSH